MLCCGDDFDGIVDEDGKVGDGVVNVGGFVDADERFVEDSKQGTEEFEGVGLEQLR